MPPKALSRSSPARDVVSGNSKLHDAIRKGAHGIMMKLIASGADVSTEMDGYTPLQFAARSGELASINILVDNGADVDGLNSSMQPPLHEAFSLGQYTAVVSLLANGASVPDDDYRLPGKSSLISAMDYGWIDMAKTIIRRMEDRPGRSQTFGQALLKAIPMNSKAGNGLALLLISKGAEVTYPLHDAAREGNIVVSEYLIGSGADVNAVSIASEDGGWRSPLHLAASYGYSNYMDILLDNGADVDGLNSSMQPPLRASFCSKQYAAVVSLLANGASVPDDDYRLPDKSSLMSAIKYGWIDVAKTIIRRMEDRPGRSHTFGQALLKAIPMNSKAGEELVQLLSDGADVTYPLHDAACADNMVVSKYLIALGADVNAKDNRIVRGSDTLNRVTSYGNVTFMKILLDNGADVDEMKTKYRNWLHRNIVADLRDAPSDIDRAVHLVAEGLDFPHMLSVSRHPLWLVAYEKWNYKVFCYLVRSTLELVDAATYVKRIFRSKVLSYTKGLIRFKGTILDYAVLLSDTMTIKHLISHYNVDVNAPTVASLKRRPLHVAAMIGTGKVTKLLVSTGATLDVVDDDGKTPRDVALENGNQSIARRLMSLIEMATAAAAASSSDKKKPRPKSFSLVAPSAAPVLAPTATATPKTVGCRHCGGDYFSHSCPERSEDQKKGFHRHHPDIRADTKVLEVGAVDDQILSPCPVAQGRKERRPVKKYYFMKFIKVIIAIGMNFNQFILILAVVLTGTLLMIACDRAPTLEE